MNETDKQILINTLQIAKEALKFYANKNNYVSSNNKESLINLDDNGHQARYAIKTIDTIINPDFNQLNNEFNDGETYNNQETIKEIYEDMLKSGMFYETYPTLSGLWDVDKDEFNNRIKKIY